MSMWKSMSAGLADLLFPADAGCVLCHREGARLCEICFGNLSARIMEDEPVAYPPVCAAAYALTYADDVREMVHRFKYDGDRALAEPMAQFLWARLKSLPWPNDLIIMPVPLHRARLRERGYNQSQILARHLAKYAQLPLVDKTLVRVVNTPSQTQLSRPERLGNLNGAFSVENADKILAQNILLVDDVLTTGATIQCCGKALLDAGAKSVFALTLAGQ